MEGEKSGNRRGRRSREEILDVASRIMAERGYAATSLSALSKETGLPKSAVYHHFESKAGLLSAVMARGAYEFYAAMREAQAGGPAGDTPRERLTWFLLRTGEVFLARPEFLRLHLLLLMSAEVAEGEVDAMIEQVRRDGRAHMNTMIAASFAREGAEIAQAVADELDYFGIAGFDGAFIGMQADPARGIENQMRLLAEAVAALGEARAAELLSERPRPAVPSEVARVREIVEAAYAPWAEAIGVRPLPMDADYEALVRAGHVHVTGPGPDGLIVLIPEDGALLVENVAVAPDAHGRGTGRRLLAFAEDRARALALPALRLYTNELMTSNIALYGRLGYRETHREDIGGRFVVHMKKSLA